MFTDDDIKRKWSEFKGGVRNQWGLITNEELDKTHKTIREIKELVSKKYSESYETINEKMTKLLSSFDNASDKGTQKATSSFARSPIVNEVENPSIKEPANTAPNYKEKLQKVAEKYRYINDTAIETKKTQQYKDSLNPNLQDLSASELNSLKDSIEPRENIEKN